MRCENSIGQPTNESLQDRSEATQFVSREVSDATAKKWPYLKATISCSSISCRNTSKPHSRTYSWTSGVELSTLTSDEGGAGVRRTKYGHGSLSVPRTTFAAAVRSTSIPLPWWTTDRSSIPILRSRRQMSLFDGSWRGTTKAPDLHSESHTTGTAPHFASADNTLGGALGSEDQRTPYNWPAAGLCFLLMTPRRQRSTVRMLPLKTLDSKPLQTLLQGSQTQPGASTRMSFPSDSGTICSRVENDSWHRQITQRKGGCNGAARSSHGGSVMYALSGLQGATATFRALSA